MCLTCEPGREGYLVPTPTGDKGSSGPMPQLEDGVRYVSKYLSHIFPRHSVGEKTPRGHAGGALGGGGGVSLSASVFSTPLRLYHVLIS